MMKTRRYLAPVIDFIIVLITVFVTVLGLTEGAGSGQAGRDMIGSGWFKAFTNLSNLLMGVSAFSALIAALLEKQTKQILTLYFCGTCAVTLTLLTVVCFLAPKWEIAGLGYFTMFRGELFFFHFFNPILAIIGCCFLHKEYSLTKADILFGILPTLLYAVLYALCVVVLKTWSDFYGFTFGGKPYMIPVSVFGIFLASFLIAYLLSRLHNHGGENE